MTDRDRETLKILRREAALKERLEAAEHGLQYWKGIKEENERLRAGRDEAMAAHRNEHKERMVLMDRIDAALAIGRSALAKADRGSAHLAAAVVPMVAALKGEGEPASPFIGLPVMFRREGEK